MRYSLHVLCAMTCVSAVVGCAAPSMVTLAAFDKAQVGMTYQEVVAAVGREGKELSRREVQEGPVVQYIWENSNGTNFVGRFENGKLTHKVQFGLQ